MAGANAKPQFRDLIDEALAVVGTAAINAKSPRHCARQHRLQVKYVNEAAADETDPQRGFRNSVMVLLSGMRCSRDILRRSGGAACFQRGGQDHRLFGC